MNKIVLVFLIVISLLVSCQRTSSSSNPPEDIINTANQFMVETYNGQGVQLINARKVPLTQADTLNGITEKWALKLECATQQGGSWVNYRNCPIIVRKNGLIKIVFSGLCE